MTNNTDGAALFPVTPQDREAYCDYEDLDGKYRERVISGAWDNVAGVQAFARHRDAEARRCAAIMQRITQAHSLPGDVGMREALEGLSLAADEINGDIDLQVNGDHSEEVDVNGEYYVTLSAAKVDALNKEICSAQRLIKQAPTLPVNPTIEEILTLAKRKYHFQPTIGAVLRVHMPTGTTGYDWDDREAFNQAIAILDHITALAALTPSALSGDAGGGLSAIAAERKRQIEVEGWSTEHDDEHADCQMAGAAACYAMSAIPHWAKHEAIRLLWPWSKDWWKPRSHRENLVRAGALIVAEIDRIDRAAALPSHKGAGE